MSWCTAQRGPRASWSSIPATLSVVLAFGCSDVDEPPLNAGPTSSFCAADAGAFEEVAVTPAAPVTETPIEESACSAIERIYTVEPSPHLENCVAVGYSTNPPSSGAHYSTWAAFQEYDEPVPHGFLVHSLEHGAVVFFYSCSSCDAEVEQARSVIAGLPVDPACASAGIERRVIMTPDPALESRWAAAAWGVTLNADCFEPSVFDAFARAHYALSPENICGGGYSGEHE